MQNIIASYSKDIRANCKSRSSTQINEDPLRLEKDRHWRKFVVFDKVKVSWFMNMISIQRASLSDGSVASQGLDVPAVLQDWQLQRVILYAVIVIVDTTMIGRTRICSVTQQGRSQGSRSHMNGLYMRDCICKGPIGAALCINHSPFVVSSSGGQRTINNLLSKFHSIKILLLRFSRRKKKLFLKCTKTIEKVTFFKLLLL